MALATEDRRPRPQHRLARELGPLGDPLGGGVADRRPQLDPLQAKGPNPQRRSATPRGSCGRRTPASSRFRPSGGPAEGPADRVTKTLAEPRPSLELPRPNVSPPGTNHAPEQCAELRVRPCSLPSSRESCTAWPARPRPTASSPRSASAVLRTQHVPATHGSAAWPSPDGLARNATRGPYRSDRVVTDTAPDPQVAQHVTCFCTRMGSVWRRPKSRLARITVTPRRRRRSCALRRSGCALGTATPGTRSRSHEQSVIRPVIVVTGGVHLPTCQRAETQQTVDRRSRRRRRSRPRSRVGTISALSPARISARCRSGGSFAARAELDDRTRDRQGPRAL